MTGDLLPCTWERDFEIKLAESLGFDPQHPMVRMEISHILRKAGYSPGMAPGPDSFSQIQELLSFYLSIDAHGINI